MLKQKKVIGVLVLLTLLIAFALIWLFTDIGRGPADPAVLDSELPELYAFQDEANGCSEQTISDANRKIGNLEDSITKAQLAVNIATCYRIDNQLDESLRYLDRAVSIYGALGNQEKVEEVELQKEVINQLKGIQETLSQDGEQSERDDEASGTL